MQPAGNSFLINAVPIAAVCLLFYFLLIRPQQQQQKAHNKMLAGLKKGDRILTNGGLYGTIIGLKESEIEVRFAENTKMIVAKSAVSKLIAPSVAQETSGAARSA